MDTQGTSAKSWLTQLRHVLGSYPTTAAEWAVRVQSPDVTKQELLVLDAWLKADPRNAEDYAQVNKVAHLGLKLRERRDELARLQGYQRLRAEEHDNKQPRPRMAWQWTVPVAAAFLLALAGLYTLLTSNGVRYVARHGEQQKVTLTDGSQMVVNTDSEVKVLYDANARLITLPRGEAFFEVAKHPGRPFIVRAGMVDVVAIGTKFSVRRQDDATAIVVTEGRVRVARTGATADVPIELAEGTGIQVMEDHPLPSPTQINASAATAWAGGTVEFEDAPLSQVIAEVNRYTPKPFVIADPRLNQVSLTGRFKVGDMESVKFALRDRFQIVVHEQAQSLQLSKEVAR